MTLPVGQLKPTARLGAQPYSFGESTFYAIPIQFGMRYLLNPAGGLHMGLGAAFAAHIMTGDGVEDNFMAGALTFASVEYRLDRFLVGVDGGYRFAEDNFDGIIVTAKVGWTFGTIGQNL